MRSSLNNPILVSVLKGLKTESNNVHLNPRNVGITSESV